jgi:5-methylcytosine-specific restriction endonuclease McrA
VSPVRLCIEQGCSQQTTGTRCPEHAKAKQRKRWASRANAAATVAAAPVCGCRGCSACGIHPGTVCGATEDLTADHTTPISRGGSNERSNLRTRCRRCNGARGNRQ